MGMDIGFEKAGFKTVYTNDIARFACNTIRKNKEKELRKKQMVCDEGDISDITTKKILEKIKMKNGKIDVVIGGPPCQAFSTAGLRNGFNDKRGIALLQFIRVIRQTRPKFFVFENVPGIKSMSKKHISFYDRVTKKGKKLSNDKKPGSLFTEILARFKKINGYDIEWKILNAADFGVPQKRKRFILIGSRVADPKKIFEQIDKEAKWADPKIARKENKKPWRTLKDALHGMNDDEKEYTNFPRWGKYLKHVPPGGCWIDLPNSIKRKAMGGAADTNDPRKKGKQGGRRGFYRRLNWNKTCPTLVTSPSHLGTCLCHPDENRPLTVMEYAKIQGFPSSWKFVGSTQQKYRMIGEAVPIKLAHIIAKKILLKKNILKKA